MDTRDKILVPTNSLVFNFEDSQTDWIALNSADSSNRDLFIDIKHLLEQDYKAVDPRTTFTSTIVDIPQVTMNDLWGAESVNSAVSCEPYEIGVPVRDSEEHRDMKEKVLFPVLLSRSVLDKQVATDPSATVNDNGEKWPEFSRKLHSTQRRSLVFEEAFNKKSKIDSTVVIQPQNNLII